MKYNIDKFHYPVEIGPGDIVGLFEMNFKSLSQFIYKTKSWCDCFFIRIEQWKSIIDYMESD